MNICPKLYTYSLGSMFLTTFSQAINVFKAIYSVVSFRSHDSFNNIGIDTLNLIFIQKWRSRNIWVSVSELIIWVQEL